MQLQVIASSSAGNAYALHPHDGGRALLVEAGINYARIQQALDHRVTRLAACLVSHEHGDHAVSARRIAKAGVPVAATLGTLHALGLAAHHRCIALPPLVGVPLPHGWSAMAFPTVHDAREPAGFVITYGAKRALYVTDTAYSPFRFDTHFDLVMIEANHSDQQLAAMRSDDPIATELAVRSLRNHLSVERAVSLLQAHDLSRCQEIVLLHMSAAHGDEVGFRRQIERATGVPTRVAAARAAPRIPEGVN